MRKVIQNEGYTLFELIAVIIIIGIIGVFMVSKVFISSENTKISATTIILDKVRLDIATFSTNLLSASGTGSYPTYLDITTPNTVIPGEIPNNPFTQLNTIRNAENEYIDGATNQNVSDETMYGWAYDQSVGKLWANSNVLNESSL